MNCRRRQNGMSLLGWLALVLVLGGAVSVGLKLFPAYSDHNTMSTLLDKMSVESGLALQRNPQLYGIITQRFKLNNIREFDVKENIQIDRDEKNGVRLIMDYEVRIPFIYNVDLVASFDKEVTLRE